MKTIIIIGVLLSCAISWGSEVVSILVHERNDTFRVDLNEDTVKCLIGDYGATSLKVLIPELADTTILNHRVPGSNAPCVTAGACKTPFNDGFSINDILDANRPQEDIVVSVKVFRRSVWNERTQQCEITMSEQVGTNIRGIDFQHIRDLPVKERDLLGGKGRPKEDCH